jgi:hypothetical protein
MLNQIRQLCPQIKKINEETFSKAQLILKYTHESAYALIKAFDDIRKSRGTAGATTDEEQDLLRAMLVMAAAGLDSMIKQLIRDVLPTLVKIDDKVQKGLETFVSRQLRRDSEDISGTTMNKFLARLLVAESHQQQVIREYIESLTGASLQSAEEVMKASFALGLDPTKQGINSDQLKEIFDIRNKIIHELDINFDAPRRNRQSRSRNKMIDYTNLLLHIGESMIIGVSEKIRSVS